MKVDDTMKQDFLSVEKYIKKYKWDARVNRYDIYFVLDTGWNIVLSGLHSKMPCVAEWVCTHYIGLDGRQILIDKCSWSDRCSYPVALWGGKEDIAI